MHPAIKLLGLGLYAEFLAQYFAAGTILLEGRTAPALLEIMSHQCPMDTFLQGIERELFAGDVLFRLCTPKGWVGTFEKWFETLDMIVDELKPEVIVPGHGPLCGVEGATGMKLIRFVSTDPSNPSFGIVITNHAVSFSVLQAKTGTLCEFLSDSQAYLAHLPDSEQAARTLLEWGDEHFQEIDEGERFALHATQWKEPIEVAALFDFGLTPR